MNVLVARLRSLDIRVNEVEPIDDSLQADGLIGLEHGYHIQMGPTYMCLNESTPRGTIKFGRTVHEELAILCQVHSKPQLRTMALTKYIKERAKARTN